MLHPLTRISHRLSRRHALAIFAIGLAVSLACGLMSVGRWAPLMWLDNALMDRLLVHAASGQPARDTVVVDIDDSSLSAVGQWPWPRYRIASLIDRIAAGHPSAIALDILFPEADRSSLASIADTFKRDFGVDVSFNGVPAGLLDNDGFLGFEMRRHDVVASDYLYFDHTSPPQDALRSGLRVDLLPGAPTLNTATGILVNAHAIASQTRTTGFVNSQLDADGVLRRLPLVIRQAGSVHVNLSLAAMMHAAGVTTATVGTDADGGFVQVGLHRVPIDAAGNALLRPNGNASFYAAISAVDVLNGKVSPADLRGKIVFVGASAVGLNDRHDTAFDPHFPGLKIQSVMAENILHDRFVETPAWAPAAMAAACVMVGVLMSMGAVAGGGVPGFVAGSAMLMLGMLAGSIAWFAHGGQYVSPGAPLLAASALFVTFMTARYAIERSRSVTWRRQLENARQVTIESMAAVAETRDPETGAHIKRTQNYVRAIALELQRSGHHGATLTKDYIRLLFMSAPLHDIGKVGVPDNILLKPGRLTFDEMEIMKQHAQFGKRIIFSTAERIDGDNFLVIAGEIAASHHEKWDGSGYPLGLAGEDIPISGRIMAVADVYDALISRRCYKEPFTHAHSTGLMREMRDTHFDPAVLDAFFRIEAEILEIAERFRDEETTIEHHKTEAQSTIDRAAAWRPADDATSSPVASPGTGRA